MAWQSLSNRLSSLPLVLAGPILRRVEKDSVSVWIACREAFDAQLYVGPALGTNGQPLDIKVATPLNPNPPQVASVKLGAHFHVAVVTTTISPVLVEGLIYQYSLLLTFTSGNDLGPKWLDGANVLKGGIASITYGNFLAPTFIVPPAITPDNVKVAHASCRKPHGGEIDALATLDDVLEGTFNLPATRPQQLFLTGDQVYTDDVDPTLLAMLMDASAALLQWPVKETAPDVDIEGKALPKGDPQLPGNRQDVVAASNFTTEDGANHLFFLGEFYAMYLFAWSDVLWPDENSFPPFAKVYPHESDVDLDFVSVPTMGGPPVAFPVTSDSDLKRAYDERKNVLTRFLRDLPKVRKALANIPSYMMLDDHEVTDDWFLTRGWCEDTLAANTLSRRIMQNALAAFAVFQAWGNTPDRFGPNMPGRDLLTLLAERNVQVPVFDWDDIGAALLPTFNPNTGNLERPPGSLEWHFTIDFGSYTLFMLDTRTHRGFVDDWRAPCLINGQHLPVQLTPVSGKYYVIIVSPAPVVGYVPIEWGLGAGVAVKSPTEPVPSRVLQRVDQGDMVSYRSIETYSRAKKAEDRAKEEAEAKAAFKSRRAALADLDYEAWGYNEIAFQALLRHMTQYSKAVILSGDVHYGFSNRLQYWYNNNGTEDYATFVQLCTSAARNTEFKPKAAEIGGTCALAFGEFIEFTYYCWENLNGKFHQATSMDDHLSDPPPDWQYRIRYAADFREAPDRGMPPTGPQSLDAQGFSLEQRSRLEYRQRLIVGEDNIGLVAFSHVLSNVTVNHSLYWSVVGDDPLAAPAAHPYTLHEVSLSTGSVPPKPWP